MVNAAVPEPLVPEMETVPAALLNPISAVPLNWPITIVLA